MKPLAVRTVVLIAATGAVVGGVVTAITLSMGWGPLAVTPFLSVLFALLAAVLVYVGWQVRRLKRNDSTWMTPLLAMRVAVGARASALVGAVCCGALGALAAVSVLRPPTPTLVSVATWAGVDALSALVLTVLAFVVERWCVVDDDPQDRDHQRPRKGRPGTPSGSPA